MSNSTVPRIKTQTKLKFKILIFSATVAQEYAKFWVGLESRPVTIVRRGAQIQPSYGNGISTTRRPYSPSPPVYYPNTERTVSFCFGQ